MSRHPRHSVIFQYSGLVIDLDSVDYAALQEPTKDNPHWMIVVSMRSSPKIIRLRVPDQEFGYRVVARIKRGMIAAASGEYHILDDDEPPDYGNTSGDANTEPQS